MKEYLKKISLVLATCPFLFSCDKFLEEKARVIAGQTLKEALHGITLDELSIGQEVLKKVFYNTKD